MGNRSICACIKLLELLKSPSPYEILHIIETLSLCNTSSYVFQIIMCLIIGVCNTKTAPKLSMLNYLIVNKVTVYSCYCYCLYFSVYG